jgi:hypothetical protein
VVADTLGTLQPTSAAGTDGRRPSGTLLKPFFLKGTRNSGSGSDLQHTVDEGAGSGSGSASGSAVSSVASGAGNSKVVPVDDGAGVGVVVDPVDADPRLLTAIPEGDIEVGLSRAVSPRHGGGGARSALGPPPGMRPGALPSLTPAAPPTGSEEVKLADGHGSGSGSAPATLP